MTALKRIGPIFLGAGLGIILLGGFCFLDSGVRVSALKLPDSDISKLRPVSSEKITGANPFGSFEKEKLAVMAMPQPPKVPNMPGEIKKSAGVKVVGVIYPDMALISKGNKTLMVTAGQSTEAGYIGDITKEGVYIDGTFFKLTNKLGKNKF